MPRVTVWYATSVLAPDAMNNPTWASRPEVHVIHAKRTGTGLTACGRDTAAWHKHWLPFDPASNRSVCMECVAVVANGRAARTGGSNAFPGDGVGVPARSGGRARPEGISIQDVS